MGFYIDRDATTVAMDSHWDGGSEMRTRIHRVGGRIIVDVTELSHNKVSKKRCDTAVRNALKKANIAGIVTRDSVMSDVTTTRQARRVDSDKTYSVVTRNVVYTF